MAHPLLSAVADARHDLGKYVCLQQKWTPADAPDSELLEALRADLLSTRSGPEGALDAVALWARLAPTLAPLRPDPELEELDLALAAIAPLLPALREGSLDRVGLESLSAQARRIPAALNRLHSRIKGA